MEIIAERKQKRKSRSMNEMQSIRLSISRINNESKSEKKNSSKQSRLLDSDEIEFAARTIEIRALVLLEILRIERNFSTALKMNVYCF